MKKFIGMINGKEFNNVDDFNSAVKDLLESGESNVIITSYYKECNDVCEGESVEENNDKKPLNVDKILLGVNSIRSNDGSYVVASNMNDLIKNASNKGEIERNVENKIESYNDSIKKCESRISKYYSDITTLEDKIKFNEIEKTDSEHKLNYYKKILDILNCEKVDEDNHKKDTNEDVDKKNDEQKVFTNVNCNEKAYDIIVDVLNGFDKYLKDIGFWNKK